MPDISRTTAEAVIAAEIEIVCSDGNSDRHRVARNIIAALDAAGFTLAIKMAPGELMPQQITAHKLPEIGVLVAALEACTVALGHIGVREAHNKAGMTDSAAAKFLMLIETSEPGGIDGVCRRAFEQAQAVLRDVKNGN